jgi:hypothetical protein
MAALTMLQFARKLLKVTLVALAVLGAAGVQGSVRTLFEFEFKLAAHPL